MAAVREVSDACLQALVSIMNPGDVVGLFNAEPVAAGQNLVTVMQKSVEQMVFEPQAAPRIGGEHVILTAADVPEMMRLVELTQPGPFAARTILLGSYLGVRTAGQLVAMAGERMRFDGFHRNFRGLHPPGASRPRSFVVSGQRADARHLATRRDAVPASLQRQHARRLALPQARLQLPAFACRDGAEAAGLAGAGVGPPPHRYRRTVWPGIIASPERDVGISRPPPRSRRTFRAARLRSPSLRPSPSCGCRLP